MKISEIKKYRELAGMSQAALADKLGVDSMTVYRWERGDRKPARLYLREIGKILNERLKRRLKGSEV